MSEQGKHEVFGGYNTYYHEAGQGEPLLLIHGSGPGVSAWANWRLVFPILSDKYHLFAPDLIGFGSSDRPDHIKYGVDAWVDHMIAFIEGKNLKKVSILGNSLGGCLALHIAHRRPELLNKIIMMGSSGIDFKLTPGLDTVWGYEPSFENMKRLIEIFSYDDKYANNNDLVEMRFRASMSEDNLTSYRLMFPAPRQQHVDAMALTEDQLRSIKTPGLFIHGREDRVVPVDTSIRMAQLLPKAELHMFPECGHWTQIEKTDSFCAQVDLFLSNRQGVERF